MGQAVAMRGLQGGCVAVVYNRRHENPGVGFAMARPDHQGFNLEFDGLAWSAQSGFRGGKRSFGLTFHSGSLRLKFCPMALSS
jgi:hypothetical protein